VINLVVDGQLLAARWGPDALWLDRPGRHRGEMRCERAKFRNVGLEGAMIGGALSATVAAGTGGTEAGYAAGAIAGGGIGALLALFAIGLRTNQILTGTAVTAGALGVTSLLSQAIFGTTGVALSVPISAPVAVPLLSGVPIVGRALFVQPPITYLVFGLVPLTWWWLSQTRHGLALRATGENPDAVASAVAGQVAGQPSTGSASWNGGAARAGTSRDVRGGNDGRPRPSRSHAARSLASVRSPARRAVRRDQFTSVPGNR
jgi:simple sugar transport system permease protein